MNSFIDVYCLFIQEEIIFENLEWFVFVTKFASYIQKNLLYRCGDENICGMRSRII